MLGFNVKNALVEASVVHEMNNAKYPRVKLAIIGSTLNCEVREEEVVLYRDLVGKTVTASGDLKYDPKKGTVKFVLLKMDEQKK